MPSTSPPHEDSIAFIVEQLHERTGRKYIDVRRRMGKYLGIGEYGEDTFNRKFRRYPTSARYLPDEMFALVNALVDGLPSQTRCTAPEAFQLFNLASIPPEDFMTLRSLFPADEYQQAWGMYVPQMPPSTPNATTDFLKPLYPQVFIGRDEDIQRMLTRLGALPNTTRHPLTVLRGWPGVGKTTFINALLHEPALNAAFPDGVLWAIMGRNGDPLAVLKQWAKQIGAQHIEAMHDGYEVAEEMRRLLDKRKILLVVDDIWEFAQGSRFKQLLGAQPTLLMTTRFTDLAERLAEVRDNVYWLGVLSEEKSLELLNVFAPTAAPAHEAEMKTLVYVLEGLPLALRVAGALVERDFILGLDVRRLVSSLTTTHELVKHEAHHIDEATGRTPTISMLFKLSVQTLQPANQRAFACMGAFAPKPGTFDLKAVEFICELDDPGMAVRALVGRGLLEPLERGRLQMHSTLSFYAEYLLKTDLKDLNE